MPEIIKSKLLPPYTGTGLIERPRLTRLLFRADRQKATILSAPAGYGKTVSMVQLANSSKKPLVWYQLDEYDNDPGVFFQYLLAGLRQHFPGFGRDMLQVAAQDGFAARRRLLVATIVNDLAEKAKDGLVIAFDDYHLLEEETIHGFVQELLKHLPAGVHLLIASRMPLPLPLARLKLQGDVLLAGPEELRFTRGEMRDFLLANGQEATEATLDALEEKTDGWPAALRLMSDTAERIADMAAVDVDRTGVYDYLAAEVLDRQPDGVRSFLLGSSVLEELEQGVCDSLLGRNDAGKMLAYLEKRRLFLIPLGKGKTYRYHQLFRDFLRARLDAGERAALLRRAGRLAREAGRLDYAVEYLAAAGCHGELSAILKDAGGEAFRRGRWQTVARWLAPLTSEALLANPWLALYKARVEVYYGRIAEAEEWTKKVAGLFAVGRDRAGLAETLVLQARFLLFKGRVSESMELLERACTLLPLNEIACRPDIVKGKCECLIALGRYGEVETTLLPAIEKAQGTNDCFATASLLEYMGLACYMKGRYPEALQYYRQAAAASPDRTTPNALNQAIIFHIYSEWGEGERAFEHAKRNVAVLENFALAEELPVAYRQLGECYADLGKWTEAEGFMNRAVELLQDTRGDRTQLVLSIMELAECLAMQGRWIEARAKAEEALAATTPQTRHARIVCWARSAPIFLRTGSVRQAREMLSGAQTYFEQVARYPKGLAYTYLFQAAFCSQLGEAAAAQRFAEQALMVSGAMNCQIFFLRWYDFLQPVLRYGLEKGVEVTFIHRVLVRLGARAAPLLAELAASPDANVRRKLVAPLAEIACPQAEGILHALADDGDGEVRQLARMALRRLVGSGDPYPLDAVPLQFATFGRFRPVREGAAAEISWPTAKTRDLLAFLLHAGEPVSRDKILESLWPEADVESATGLFHTTLYYLRRVLAELGCRNFVVYSGKQYKLTPGGFATDRQQFQTLLAASQRDGLSPEAAAGHLEEAAALYSGHYLEELDYSWVIPAQENLRQSYVGALLRLARHYIALKEYDQALTHLQKMEDAEPFDEQVHVLLMTVFAGQGNRPAVKRQYLKLEGELRKELGLAPSPATRALYQDLVK